MAKFPTNKKGAPPKAPVKPVLNTPDTNETSTDTDANVNFKVSLADAKAFRVYCKLLGKKQVDVFLEAYRLHKEAHKADISAALDEM